MELFKGTAVTISVDQNSNQKTCLLMRKTYGISFGEKRFTQDEIEGFVYGGLSSRFWLMKMFINKKNP